MFFFEFFGARKTSNERKKKHEFSKIKTPSLFLFSVHAHLRHPDRARTVPHPVPDPLPRRAQGQQVHQVHAADEARVAESLFQLRGERKKKFFFLLKTFLALSFFLLLLFTHLLLSFSSSPLTSSRSPMETRACSGPPRTAPPPPSPRLSRRRQRARCQLLLLRLRLRLRPLLRLPPLHLLLLLPPPPKSASPSSGQTTCPRPRTRPSSPTASGCSRGATAGPLGAPLPLPPWLLRLRMLRRRLLLPPLTTTIPLRRSCRSTWPRPPSCPATSSTRKGAGRAAWPWRTR